MAADSQRGTGGLIGFVEVHGHRRGRLAQWPFGGPFQDRPSHVRQIRALAHDPPLVLTLRLPSGRTTTLRLQINHVFNPYAGGSVTDPHVPWPRVLSTVACHQ